MATSRSDEAGGQAPAPPSPEEVAAIVAAVETAWPRARPAAKGPGRRSPGWRFSGRWWAADEGVRRRP